jgi:hypothetical protein
MTRFRREDRMSARPVVAVLGLIVGSLVTVLAKLPTPTPALDRRGKPLPFGVQPYFLPDVPLGTGSTSLRSPRTVTL